MEPVAVPVRTLKHKLFIGGMIAGALVPAACVADLGVLAMARGVGMSGVAPALIMLSAVAGGAAAVGGLADAAARRHPTLVGGWGAALIGVLLAAGVLLLVTTPAAREGAAVVGGTAAVLAVMALVLKFWAWISSAG